MSNHGNLISYINSSGVPEDVKGTDGAAHVTDAEFSRPVDDTGTYTYLGKGPIGSDGADAVWQVKRITNATSSSYIATGPGSSTTTQIWDNRASLTYVEA